MLFIRNYSYPFNAPETISMGASYVSLAQFKSFRHFKTQHDTYSFNSKVEKNGNLKPGNCRYLFVGVSQRF